MLKMRGAAVFKVLLQVAKTSSDSQSRMEAWNVIYFLLQSTQVQRRALDVFPGLPGVIVDLLAQEDTSMTEKDREIALVALALLSETSALPVFRTPGLVRLVVEELKLTKSHRASYVLLTFAQSNHPAIKEEMVRDVKMLQVCMSVVVQESDATSLVVKDALAILIFLATDDENRRIVSGDEDFLTTVLERVRANDADSGFFIGLLLELSLSPAIAGVLDRPNVLRVLCQSTWGMSRLALASIVEMDPMRLDALGVEGPSLANFIWWHAVASLTEVIRFQRIDHALVLLSRMCERAELQLFLVGREAVRFHSVMALGLARELAEGDDETVALAVSTWLKLLRLPGLSWVGRRGCGDVLVGLLVVVATVGPDERVRVEAKEALELMVTPDF